MSLFSHDSLFKAPDPTSSSTTMAQPAPPVQGATVSSSISWSAIDESAIGLEKLRLLCHSGKELKKEGYVVTALSLAQIESKLRCMKCGSERQPA